MSGDIAARLEMLTKLPLSALQNEWHRTWGVPAPLGTPDHLMRGIAWKFQAASCGIDLVKLERRLDELADQPDPVGALLDRSCKPKPGTHLIREYGERRVVVAVTDTGFLFDGKIYNSLTALASTITGRNTPGPAFFGLQTAKVREIADA